MSATCQRCGAKSDLFLCPRCVVDLREMLSDFVTGGTVSVKLPDGEIITRRPQGLLYHLEQAAIGQVKLGGGGRGSSRGEPFSGEDDAIREGSDPAKLRAQFLATGRVNARASERLDAVRNTLATTIRHLCETRSIRLVWPRFIGPLRPGEARGPHRNVGDYARWLAVNVAAIACDETAGETFAEIEGHQKAIERIVNRPIRQVWVGQCPTWHEQTRQNCGVSLWAPEDAVEIRCHRCRQTHNCDRLKLMLYSDLEREKVPWSKILQANKSQPEDRQIPERTLQSWRKPGKKGEPPKLRARLYRRRDGRTVINRHSEDDEPLYLWSDVRKLRDAKPQKKVTGAAARQRVAN